MDPTLCKSRAQTWRFTEKTKKHKMGFSIQKFYSAIARPIAIESCQCKF